MEEGEAAAADDGEKRAEEVEESGDVKNVRPEEHAAWGARADWETEEPLECGGSDSAPPPEPPWFANLRGGGDEKSGEDNGGDKGHGETVDGRNRAEWVWDWTRAAAEGD